MSTAPVLVVGAGPSGLLQALFLAHSRRRPVVVIEQQPAIGGMFASMKTPWGLVDQGVHILQETGDAEWDALFPEILPPGEWHWLEGVHRDVAGNLFAGKLDTGSLYPDLRRLPAADHARCVNEIKARASRVHLDFGAAPNLHAYLESRFGPYTTDTVYRPLAHKIWRQPLERLSPWTAKIVHLTRVVTHDAGAALELKTNPGLDEVIGYPDQLSFPTSRFKTVRRALYPRKFGLATVVAGLRAALERHGAQILVSTKVKSLEVAGGKVRAAQLETPDGACTLEIDGLLWTSPQAALLATLGQKPAPAADPPIPHRTVHLFMDRPPATGPLYWLWSYEGDGHLVRISNPAAYCPDAVSGGLHPVCAELHVPDATTPDAEAIALAARELRAAGLIEPGAAVKGASVLPVLRSFFVPTTGNCAAVQAQAAAVRAAGIANLVVSTQDIASGVFYLSDVLNASLNRLDVLC